MSDELANAESYIETPSTGGSSSTGADSQIGRYTLESVLGVGGMGQVWRAHDQFKNRVALKMMLPGNATVQSQIQRFRREADIMAKLPHRNICRIFEVGEVDGLHYIAMELVEGVTLEDLLHVALPQGEAAHASTDELSRLVRLISKRKETDPNYKQHPIRRVLPVPMAINLMSKICDAVQFAHEHGILHRDLKPGNIMLREDGEPIVMDFGLGKLELDEHDASLTMSGFMLGTMQYMSPEQSVSSKEVGPATDVYSLGAILYQMLTGRHHFKVSGSLVQDAQSLQEHEPVAPSRHQRKIDRDIDTIVLKALSAKVDGRYKAATELAEDLKRQQRGEAIKARPLSLLELTVKFVKRHLLESALIFTIAILGAASWAVISYVVRSEAKLREVSQLEQKRQSENEIKQLQLQASKAQEDAENIRKQFEEARRREDTAKKKEQEAQQLLNKAQREREEARKAAEDARQKMQTGVSPVALQIVMARDAISKKQWQKATDHIHAALEQDSKSAEAWILNARLKAAVFDLRGAAHCMDQAAKTGRKIQLDDRNFGALISSFVSVLRKNDKPWNDGELQRAFIKNLKSSGDDESTWVADFLAQADVKLMESATTPAKATDSSEAAEISMAMLIQVPQMRPKEVTLVHDVVLEMKVRGEKIGKVTARAGQKVILKNIQDDKLEIALAGDSKDSSTSAWIDSSDTNLMELVNGQASASTRRTTRQSLIDEARSLP